MPCDMSTLGCDNFYPFGFYHFLIALLKFGKKKRLSFRFQTQAFLSLLSIEQA